MSLDAIFQPIRDDLARVETEIVRACVTTVPTITQVVQYIVQNGGKRVRPALTILAAQLAGYTADAAPRIGAALEMVHTASLLHDDVVDSAPTRRGQPSANALWGNQISVLVGDFFWCKACQLIVEHGNPRILHAITEAIVGTTEGQVVELVKSNDLAMQEEDYLHIIKHKTALLLAVACRVGGMLADATEAAESALARYGLDLGMAFQLADDALDYDGDERRLGKICGTDLHEGHVTLPVLYTMRRCTEIERTEIKTALLAPRVERDQLKSITNTLARYGAITHTRALAQTYVAQAKAHLQHFAAHPARTALETLADYVVARGE